MNEASQAELIEWLRKSAEFVDREAPAFASELLFWAFWSNLTCAVLFAVLAGVCVWLACRGSRRNSDAGFWMTFIGGIGAIGCVLLAIVCTHDFVKVLVAPRVVIVESLTKGGK